MMQPSLHWTFAGCHDLIEAPSSGADVWVLYYAYQYFVLAMTQLNYHLHFIFVVKSLYCYKQKGSRLLDIR